MKPEEVSTAAVSADGLEIPLIDFAPFLLSNDETAKRRTAQAIVEGFKTAGFIYLSNHGIPRSEISATFAESARFFARPEEEKEQLGWTTPEANRGYSRPGREKTTDAKEVGDVEAKRAEEGADLKESFEIGREGEAEHPNLWPPGDDGEEGWGFREQMLSFWEGCQGLHLLVMRAIAVGLGIEEDWFEGFCGRGDNTLRLLHYPEVKAEVFREKERRVRAGAHTDYGSITLLFQDQAGGLEVLSPHGTFVPATPIPDTIVVNAADLLARWSNDTIKSTKHRVVEPPTRARVHPARYSIAYFCNPNFDRFIDAIPGTYGPDKAKLYKGINSGEYLAKRLAATY